MHAVDSSSTEVILRGRNRALQELARGASLENVLTTLTLSAEEVFPELRCTILLLDAEKQILQNCAAPSMPDFYVQATHGLAVGPEIGSCGAAAYLGRRVVVEDVTTHSNWSAFRELARQADFRACWSEPIFASSGGILGTFAMYYKEPRAPRAHELEFIESTAHLAGIAIERKRTELALRESEERFRQLAESIREVFWLTDWKRMKVLYVSPAYEAIWGASCQSLYDDATSWSERIHPEDRERAVAAFARNAERGTYDVEYRVVHAESVRWIHDRAYPIRDERGEVVRMAGISEDITEQKVAQLSRYEGDERFRQMADAIRELFWLMDWKSMTVLYVSPACKTIWGRPAELIVSGEIEWYDDVHPEDRERVLQAFLEHAQTGDYNEEFRLIHPDGSIRWIHERAFPIRDERGEIYRMAGISEDVTARKVAENSLRESESRFRQMAETISEALRLRDWETRELLYISPAFEKIWGRSVEELFDKETIWEESIHPDDRERVTKSFDLNAELGTFDEEYRIIRPDDTVRWIHDRAFPIRDESGRVVRLAGIAEDISAYKNSELALRELDSRFKQLAESIREIVWLSDWKNRRVLYVNPAWEKIWGTSRDVLYDKPGTWAEGIHSKDRARVVKAFEEGAEQGVYDEDFRIIRPDGTTRWIHERAFPIRDDAGRVYRMAGIAEDITNRRKVELELEKARHELDARRKNQLRSLTSELLLAEERERRKLALDLHDGMNQTITLALMKLSHLREEAAEEWHANIREVEGLIEEGNEASRSLTFQLSPPILHDLGFEPAVQWLVEDIQRRYGLSITLEERETPSPLDERVRILLFRAVRELLINVAKHAKAKRALVHLEHEERSLLIRVEDDGIAFDPAAVGRRGVGLDSIRERLSHLGGKMVIESEPGTGTRVSLIAPLSNTDESTAS